MTRALRESTRPSILPLPGARPLAPIGEGGDDGSMIGVWLLYAGILVLTGILWLQESKRALLPAAMTAPLWCAVLISLTGVLVLRSGWRRNGDWAREQLELGTLSNSFYAPRRESMTQGFAVAGGVFVGLWWGLANWAVLLNGMRQSHANRGLFGFEMAAVVGAITGGVVGAVIGVYVGDLWERRHRQRRMHARASA